MPHPCLLGLLPPSRRLTTASAGAGADLLRLCTVLYQQQHAPDTNLDSHLHSLPLPTPFPHDLFIQVCNNFPLSWRPIHALHLHLLRHHHHSFSHTPTTLSKMLSVFGRSRNISLLWSSLLSSSPRLLTPKTLETAARSLAEAREIKKCVRLFDLIDPSIRNTNTLNRIIAELCRRRLVDVAGDVVSKVRSFVSPDEETYVLLIVGFCRKGEMVEGTKLWNKMVDEGMEPGVEAYTELVETMLKNNRHEDAMKLFKSARGCESVNLGIQSYGVVIGWASKQGRIRDAYMVLGEMLKRGVGVDDRVLGDIVYALTVKRRVREGYMVLEGVLEPDIGLYHGLIKGLLRLRRAGEATQVFREMVRRGCEPNMHTYIMLLQGHLGKRGRKGKDPLVNFESIFVGGLVKVGRTLDATKFVERMMWGGVEVPRFDYNQFLHCFSNEEGVVMFEEVGRRLREAGLLDLGDIFLIYGERMSTRDRRRRARVDCSNEPVLF